MIAVAGARHSRGAGGRLAVRAPAAAPCRTRRQVPAVRLQNAVERAAGDRGLASRAAGGQPAADDPRRRRAGSRGSAGRRGAGRGPARSGHHHALGRADRPHHRLDRRGDRRRFRHRVHLRAGDRDEGQLRPRPGYGVRHREESRVRAAGNRAAAEADAVVADGELRRPRVSGRRGVRAARVWAAPLRTARLGYAGVARRHHPRRSRQVPQDLVRGQQRHPRRGRRRDHRRGVCRRRARVRRLGQGRECRGAGRGARRLRPGAW